MWRSGLLVCAVGASALAQPGPTGAPPGYAPIYLPEPPPRPDRFFVALDAGFGGGNRWLYGAYSLEAAVTIVTAPVRLRARGFTTLAGGTMESDWSGGYDRHLAGVEGRWCTHGLGACGFLDLDVGYEYLSLYDHSGDFVRSDSGLVAGPRFGFDVGGGVRFRMALELYQHYGRHRSGSNETHMQRFGTVGLAIAVGYQF